MPSPEQVKQFVSALKPQCRIAGQVTLRVAMVWDEATYKL
jgi:hypothetical protein